MRNSGYRFLATFEFDEIYKAQYPEKELRQIFEIGLEQARKGAEQKDLNPNFFVLQLHSGELDYQVTSRIREINKNAIEQVMLQFEKEDQSNMAKGRVSVITAPFQIDVFAIQLKNNNRNFKSNNNNNNRKRKRPGGHRRLRIRPIAFQINKNGLYTLNNIDNYCIFRSITILIAKSEKTKQRFYDFMHDDRQQLEAVSELLDCTRIPRNENFYDIEECGNIIQKSFLDVLFPGKYRIFCFENSPLATGFKPFFKSDAETFSVPLNIYYWAEDRHYEPIKSIRLFLDGKSKMDYCYTVCFSSFLFLFIFFKIFEL